MQVKNIYQPFECENVIADTYSPREYKNTYFEMVFIFEGTGIQQINAHHLPYSPNKLFIIFPQDTHSFQIHDTTHFFVLRFNEDYLKSQAQLWLKKLEYIFFNHDHMPGCILKNTADKTLIRALAEAITREYELQIQSGNEVIKQLVNTFITVAARNISLKQLHNRMPSEQPVSLQGYIHQNIYSPEKLQVAAFANEFNISPNYLGELFKKQTGLTLQRYIASYRLKLIEARLRYTNNRLNEIAAEFGFSDMSHLNKFFTRHNGISPSAYRKKAKL